MKTLFALFVSLLAVAGSSAQTFDSLVEPFLSNYCLDCHDSDVQKGGISLHDLTEVSADNAVLWKSVWEQIALKEMPPRNKKNQPEVMERLHLSQWITGELETRMKDVGGFTQHHHPKKANHLPHELLFGDIPAELGPTSSPARIWRIHPNEHLVRLNALINKEPEFNSKQPGARAAGDHIPWNNQGETKVYYGLDRIRGWVGGSAAIAAAKTGFPAALSEASDHGLRSYPILYSVNGSEATQIASNAE
ncbi:MAG: c-type cytochrome domain-containing protein, partial [Verrucomicrobiota bacterium]